MPSGKRAAIYFDDMLHKALLVNASVRSALAEDAEDLDAFRARAAEPSLAFEDFVQGLKRDGKL